MQINNYTVLANMHMKIDRQIYASDKLTIEKSLNDKIKFALYCAADNIFEVLENLERANTLNITERI